MTSHSPLLSALQHHALRTPEKVALISGDQTLTYAQLFASILSAARLLEEKGLSAGDRLGLSTQDGLAFVALYFGAHLLGAVNVVVDPESNPQKMDVMLSLTQPKLTIGFTWGKIPAVDFGQIVLGEGEAISVSRDLSADDTADIVFTTGTTGKPKGVLLSHNNIFGSASNINAFVQTTSDDVEALGLPLCHSFGLGRVRCTLLAGATMVLLGSFANIPRFFKAIETHHVTGFGMVPAIWAYIRKLSGTRIAKYADQIRYIEIGSAAMPLEQKEALCELFPKTRLCHHYGLTEASRSAFMEYHSSEDLTTIGREVCDKVSIAILDDTGQPVADGAIGELCVRGNMVMKGYLKAEETEAAFWGDYFRTGDEGYRAPDGNLYLVGRAKEIINVGGKKVSPVEIEDALIALGVTDCICVGIPDPDGILGEVPKAYLLKGGTTLSFEALHAELRKHLELYKLPVTYEWIEAIPQTASGKKQRLALK